MPDRTNTRIQKLEAFAEWARRHIQGDERGEAQIFLDRLFQAFDHKGSLDVGGTPEFRVRRAADSGGGVAFADYVWKPVVLIEMKRRGTPLAKHLRQAFDYWTRLAPNRPQYVVLCNFDEFLIYNFDVQLDSPLDAVRLEELPTHYGPLAFLFPEPERPVFRSDREAVTRDAAATLAFGYQRLVARGVPPGTAQRFTLQLMVALFSEHIGLLPKYILTRILDEATSPAIAYDLLGGLFAGMNSKSPATGGRFKDVPYFNGGLFASPAAVELTMEEVALFRKAAEYTWSNVRPEIFGAIFESSMESTARHASGSYFTSPVDIMKIVGPTIVEPWQNLIENATSIPELESLLERMTSFRVLDPACGSGNFLYVAYRELKRLEARIYERQREKRRSTTRRDQQHLRLVGSWQFYGLDVNPFAVELAKVTLMIAHKLAIDELGLRENALPLDNLDKNFRVCDALLSNGDKTSWPPADVIIGNPPFLGAKRIKPERGDEYTNELRSRYKGEVSAMADYCTYWFRRAHDHLPECNKDDPVRGRAGLVGTQNVRSGQSKASGLDYIVRTGTIVDAVANQPWSGDANVHVSIVNWMKTKSTPPAPSQKRLWIAHQTPDHGRAPQTRQYELHANAVPIIGAGLTADVGGAGVQPLQCNKNPKRCFQGKIPGYDGFMLDESLAEDISRDSADVVVPYLTGRELLDDFKIERWAIDFGNRSLDEASGFVAAFGHCERRVLPKVKEAAEQAINAKSDMAAARGEHLQRWWQFWNRRDELSSALAKMRRYIGCSRVTRRPVFVFLDANICPSDLIQVFAFEDDYSFGVLQSAFHFDWFAERSSRLKVESDMRYSVREVFETFPWPQGPEFAGPSKSFVDEVAEAGREIRRSRARVLRPGAGGLRALYRALELPGESPLRRAHEALDAAVARAYGIEPSHPRTAFLSHLNVVLAERLEKGEQVAPPGIPPAYPESAHLTSSDCYAEDVTSTAVTA